MAPPFCQAQPKWNRQLTIQTWLKRWTARDKYVSSGISWYSVIKHQWYCSQRPYLLCGPGSGRCQQFLCWCPKHAQWQWGTYHAWLIWVKVEGKVHCHGECLSEIVSNLHAYKLSMLIPATGELSSHLIKMSATTGLRMVRRMGPTSIKWCSTQWKFFLWQISPKWVCSRIANMGLKGKCKAADETGAWSQAKKKVKDDIWASKVVTCRSAHAGLLTKEDMTMENA